MPGYKTRILAVALLGLAALPASAQQANSAQSTVAAANSAMRANMRQWRAQTAITLSSRADANALLTAALLGGSGSAGRMQLLDRAVKADPASANLAVMALLSCEYTRGCKRQAYTDRVHTLDPGNALAWMPQLYANEMKHDALQVGQILQVMGQSSHFRTYQLAIAGRVEAALRSVPASPDAGLQALGPNPARAVQATAMTQARGNVPAYRVILHACLPDAPQAVQRRADCRSIGLLLEQGETLLENRVGLTLHRHAANDEADQAQALAEERRLDWQLQQYSRTPPSRTATGMAALVQAQRQTGGQAGAIQAMLTNAGVALDPPANWEDKAQMARLAREKRAPAKAPAQATAKPNP